MTNQIPDEVWAPYTQTHLLFEHNSTKHRLVPDSEGNSLWPWEDAIEEIFIISAIHPRSKQSSDSEIAKLNTAMTQQLNELGYDFISCIGTSPTGDWQESSFLITNAEESDIVALCFAFDQNAYFHWTSEEWSVNGVFSDQRFSSAWHLL